MHIRCQITPHTRVAFLSIITRAHWYHNVFLLTAFLEG
jgi:hypothetical protein